MTKKLLGILFGVILLLGLSAAVQADDRPLSRKKPASRGSATAPTPVPEPISIALLGGGLVGLYGLKKKLGKD